MTKSASTCIPTPTATRRARPSCWPTIRASSRAWRGRLALVGANIVDARTYTTKDGFATAVFWVQDGDGHPYAADRLPRLRKMIERTLKGEIVAREALAGPRQAQEAQRAFRFPTHITFDNEGSDVYTVIEVDTRDRPGLLYDLTRTLAENHIQIASAVIATFGAQVVDTFYVKDMFGLKLHQQAKREALEKKLRQAIKDGAERAEKAERRLGGIVLGSPRPAKTGDETDQTYPGFLSVGAWTLASRIVGFVRDVMIAAYLGTGPVAQAYIVAFTLPNMFRRFFAEGAFNTAFVPMFAKKLEAGDDPRGFAEEAFGLAFVVLVFSVIAQFRHALAGAGCMAAGFSRATSASIWRSPMAASAFPISCSSR
jgi:predicted amino acid-binding ACT domain protein